MFSLIRRGDRAVIHDTYVENEVLTMDLSVHFPNVEELVNPVRSWVCHSAAPTKQMSGQQWACARPKGREMLMFFEHLPSMSFDLCFLVFPKNLCFNAKKAAGVYQSVRVLFTESYRCDVVQNEKTRALLQPSEQ